MGDTFTDTWYLLRCRQNYWQIVQQNLHEVGLNTCCPLILERKKRSDRKNCFRLKNAPAFPGYIFVEFNPVNIHTSTIKKIPGAMDFVKFGNKIATISHREIEALKLLHHEVGSQEIHVPQELAKQIGKIISSKNPGERIDALFSMLAPPSRTLRSNNAN